MSIEHSAIEEEEARQKAEKVLRFQIGTFPRLGAVEEEETEYIYPLNIRLPRVIFGEKREEPIDVKFLSGIRIGEIRVDATTGEVDRPRVSTIDKRIREREEEIDQAVQKALVSASAGRFSLLPFPENQYAPIQDILSEIILNDEIGLAKIEEMNDEKEEKYTQYINDLVEVGLLEERNRIIKAGDFLKTILRDTDYEHDALNTALGHYFQERAGDVEMIRAVLGPYLTISGYYYRRALEMDQLPVITEEELQKAVKQEYSGQDRSQKLFKMSRYLIQLEEVGILESVRRNGQRLWVGKENIKADLMQQRGYLAPIAEVVSAT